MKAMKWSILAAAAVLAIGSPAEAQTRVDLHVTPFAGGTFFLNELPARLALEREAGAPLEIVNGKYGNTYTVGAFAGVRIHDRYGIEGMFSWMPTTLTSTGADDINANAYMYGVNLQYLIPVTAVVEPYLSVGVGGETYDYDVTGLKTHSHLMWNFGAGVNLVVTPNLALRVEARNCMARMASHIENVDAKLHNDLMLTAGVSFKVPLTPR